MSERGTWKITVGGDDLATYEDIVKGEPITGGPKFLPVEGYGAANIQWLDLGNEHLHRRFTMTREHPDNTESTDWYLTAAQQFNGVADVLLSHQDYAGAETSYLIAGAQVTVEVAEPVGVCSITTININGGIAVRQA
ncbi:MAG: hypothetical protein WCH99_10030 [Verrucomicrobiota bacterium]